MPLSRSFNPLICLLDHIGPMGLSCITVFLISNVIVELVVRSCPLVKRTHIQYGRTALVYSRAFRHIQTDDRYRSIRRFCKTMEHHMRRAVPHGNMQMAQIDPQITSGSIKYSMCSIGVHLVFGINLKYFIALCCIYPMLHQFSLC